MFIHFDRNAANPFPRTAPGQVRSVAAADRTRPFFDPAAGVSLAQSVAVRELRQTENGGIGNYHALDVRLARAFAKRYQVGMHYVWASAVNTVTNDHLGSNPNEWSDVVRGERGPSEYLQRQRMVANGSVTLMWGLQASAYAVLASGQAVNPLTGVDNNGDANLFDRPAGFGRNAFRGREHRSFDFSLAKPVKLSEGVLLQIRGDIFNAFNNQNFYAFNAVYGDTGVARATFLQPIGGVANADPGRQFTFGAKLVF